MNATLSSDQAAQLRAFSRLAAQSAATADFDATWANFALRELARRDLSVACLAWRQATNALRLAAFDARGPSEALHEMTQGCVVASAFAPARIIATTARPGEITVAATGVMVTGARYASSMVLDATLDGARTAMVVPASTISHVARPAMAGLNTADNAVVSIDGTVGADAILGRVGAASEVISLPYRVGLTMGSVALGGADRLIGMLLGDAKPTQDTLGPLLAQHAAAAALIDAAPDDTTGWKSHAAKLAATAVAADLAAHCRARTGARTYAASHPLNDLERDLAGISYQAPTNEAAAHEVLAAFTRSDLC